MILLESHPWLNSLVTTRIHIFIDEDCTIIFIFLLYKQVTLSVQMQETTLLWLLSFQLSKSLVNNLLLHLSTQKDTTITQQNDFTTNILAICIIILHPNTHFYPVNNAWRSRMRSKAWQILHS